ncbi:Coenzyme PQQ synthesis protein D (PqqD) [Aliiruegeria lutimaris]|uniref:Coenzyme PQQ synthesis protein D (PqqD) n=1 Tax=Aliiruegeria lutimaris TaxID=571298 RepID=A0A1G9DTY2_9RHOB|nr:Coenzyme PQQ synthesis protein D (PqqD) [Aliiruegeria lutimaris]
MHLSLDDIVTKRAGQMEADIGAETLMMRIDSGRYFSVSETGLAIWREMDGEVRVSSIVDALLGTYDVGRMECEAETLRFLNDLMTHDLIERVQDCG